MLEESIERRWPPVDPRAGPWESEAPPSLLCPWNVLSTHHPIVGGLSRTQPWESTVVLRPSGLNVDLTQWRLLYKLLRFQLIHVVIYSCCGHECSWYESANWKNPENTIIRGMGGYTQIWVGHVAYPGLLTLSTQTSLRWEQKNYSKQNWSSFNQGYGMEIAGPV